MPNVKISEIKLSKRSRKDMGDIDALAESIRLRGLLQPLAVWPDMSLACGLRRLRAVKKLGWEEIAVFFLADTDDLLERLFVERDENTCRKDFAPSEAVDLGEKIEKRIAAENAAKQKAQGQHGSEGGRGNKKENPCSNLEQGFDEPRNSRSTASRAAEAVGMKRVSYTKAKAVVSAAKETPSPDSGEGLLPRPR